MSVLDLIGSERGCSEPDQVRELQGFWPLGGFAPWVAVIKKVSRHREQPPEPHHLGILIPVKVPSPGHSKARSWFGERSL